MKLFHFNTQWVLLGSLHIFETENQNCFSAYWPYMLCIVICFANVVTDHVIWSMPQMLLRLQRVTQGYQESTRDYYFPESFSRWNFDDVFLFRSELYLVWVYQILI